MPQYKITYFDARGRAEVARLLFAAAGVDYEDDRFAPDQWPARKASAPFGQVPMLTVDGKDYGQSVAINNYVARELGFHGKTNIESLAIDQVVQIVQDFMLAGVAAFMEKDEAKKEAAKKTYEEETVPKFMGFLIKLLEESPTEFFVGSSVTLADISVYDFCVSLDSRIPGTTEKFPVVKALCDRVASQPKIKAYVASRKETTF